LHTRFRFRDSHSYFNGSFLKVIAVGRGMLLPMQQSTNNSPSPASPSFAGLLASLTAPAPKTAWNNDDLAYDVATLSYEHALRAHARYKSPDSSDPEFKLDDGSGVLQTEEAPGVEQAGAAQAASLRAAPGWNESVEPRTAQDSFTLIDDNRKCASITIRLSKTECDQLRKRASQAGLTVSAYLRSCTFEAEALRAQVKDVLAELRMSAPAEEERRPAVVRRTWFEWLLRFMPRWQSVRRVARV